MKVVIDKDACIGCGSCSGISDKVFIFNGVHGYAEVNEKADFFEYRKEIDEAVNSCPTGAITIEGANTKPSSGK